MNKENLRKCIATIEGDEITLYFHKWIEVAEKELHPYDESQDKIVIVTKALVEDINTGEIHIVRLSSFEGFTS